MSSTYQVWSVYVGGDETNDFLLDELQAHEYAFNWVMEGYEDVMLHNHFTGQWFELFKGKWQEVE